MKTILLTGPSGNIGQAVLRFTTGSPFQLFLAYRREAEKEPSHNYLFFDFDCLEASRASLEQTDILFLLRLPHNSDVEGYFASLLQTCSAKAKYFPILNSLRFFIRKKREEVSTPFILVRIMLHYLPRFQRLPAIRNDCTQLTGKQSNSLPLFSGAAQKYLAIKGTKKENSNRLNFYTMLTYDFSGKTVFISGGSSGLGLASAKAFAGAGAQVLIASRNPKKAEAELRGTKADVHYHSVDFGQPSQIKALFEQINSDFGQLDFALNCAAGESGIGQAVMDFSEEEFDTTMNVSLKGLWLCMKEEIRLMQKKQRWHPYQCFLGKRPGRC